MAVVEDVVRDATGQVEVKAYSATFYTMMLFCSLALEVELNCPGVSIEQFLREVGLELARDDGRSSAE
jgi:hypothetical protein